MNIKTQLDNFLKDHIENDGGWPPVSADEITELHNIFTKIIEVNY